MKYFQVLFRYKILTDTMYDNFKGTGKILSSSNTPDKEWRYPKPGSGDEVILKLVCQNWKLYLNQLDNSNNPWHLKSVKT